MTALNVLTLPDDFEVAQHVPLIYKPKFWNPEKAYADYSPDIEAATLEGHQFRLEHKLKTAQTLWEEGLRIAIMMTDLQHDFRKGGRLPVSGTDDVVLRVCARFLNGIVTDHYTLAVDSQDGHPAHHISYATSWQTAGRKPFDLRVHKAAVLELVDEKRGIFKATSFEPDGTPIDMGLVQRMFNQQQAVRYWYHLQATGQGPIWLFANHCRLGTDGTNLHPLVAEVLAFAEGARMLEPVPIFKGHIRDTDWFGPLEPCMPDPSHPQGQFQKPLVDACFKPADRLDCTGVAEDFCEHNMRAQLMRHFRNDPDFLRKMAFMTDGTAPIVPNAPHVLALNAEAEAKGVRFFTHDEPLAA